MDRPWSTGFFKEPGKSGLEAPTAGDGQPILNIMAVLKAVLVYAEHYPSWQTRLNLPNLSYLWGKFYSYRSNWKHLCALEISMTLVKLRFRYPTSPASCWKLSRRWQIRDLHYKFQCTGQTGWYFRVLRRGALKYGTCVARSPLSTVDDRTGKQIMHHDLNNRSSSGLARLSLLHQLATHFAQSCR